MIAKYEYPFEHYVIDNFLDEEFAKKLSNEFLHFDSPDWFVYQNPVEVKKSLNNWYNFPPLTYNFFTNLNSSGFISYLSNLTGVQNLYPDLGLHGGGWHIHGQGGKLNIHLDYSIHPRLHLLRKYNLILYLSQDWDPTWGGNLEFWSHDSKTKKPKEMAAKIDCKFNRAVLFDASKHSWHGFNDPINCPDGQYRKSIAIYYLTDVPEEVDDFRERALYSPTKEQETNPEILEFIKKRADKI
jgi:Rps23 Pro-64 3,4-dihydroxylase Tpa1-like proline 4-hydroxylase